MRRCYVDDQQQDWKEFAFTLTYAYKSQTHLPTNACSFDLMLNRRIPDFTTKSTVSTGKWLLLLNNKLDSLLQYGNYWTVLALSYSTRKNVPKKNLAGFFAMAGKR